ncbi:MAG: TolB family protein [Planctomycetota bacterium]|jgi:Tol biopolymer transport system component
MSQGGNQTRTGAVAIFAVLALAALIPALEARAEEEGHLFDIAYIDALYKIKILEVHADGVGFEREVEDLPEGEVDRLTGESNTRRLTFLFRDNEEFKHYVYFHDLVKAQTNKVAQLQFQSPTYPVLSPDGKYLCYVDKAKKADEHKVVTVSVDGKRSKVISEKRKVWDGPVFVDRRTVVFGTVTDTQYTQSLDAYFLTGKKSKPLLTSAEVPEDVAKKRVKPNFCPSSVDIWRKGKRILWLDWGETTPAVMQIRQTTVMGGKSRWMTELTRNVIAARYSPNGAWIAFLSAGEKLGTDDVYVIRNDGRGLKKLATINKQPYRGWMFTWGLHSKYVIYLHNPSKKPGSMREIYLHPVEGDDEPRRLTQNEMCESYLVCLAPGEEE